jgi:hypothetical protein
MGVIRSSAGCLRGLRRGFIRVDTTYTHQVRAAAVRDDVTSEFLGRWASKLGFRPQKQRVI